MKSYPGNTRRGLAALGLLALLHTGCSSRGPRALPQITSVPQQDRQAVGSAKYALEAGGELEIYHQGYGVRSAQGVAVPTMRIQVSVANESTEPMTFRAADTKLVDNRGDTLVFSDLRRDGQPAASLVELSPGEHAQVDLYYDLPASYAMEKVENFRIYWSYDQDQGSVAEETLFVRKDPENMFWKDRRGKERPYRYFMAVKA